MRRTPGILSFILFWVTACASQSVGSTPRPVTVIPYLTQTRTMPQTTLEGLAPLKTPLPTSTPLAYTVGQGETITSIALKFGVSIDDLVAANPQVSPNAMAVGTVLKIPADPNNPSGEPTPTPAPLTVSQIECYPTSNKGMWCFVLVHNDFAGFVENTSAQVTLMDVNETMLTTQTALLPLNILPPDTSLPLAAYFPPAIPVDAKPQVQILTAILLLPGDARYLPATVHNTLVQINADGHFARINGEVLLPAGSQAATRVWVAAVAYDENGLVVGVRRWEGGGIQPGGRLPFEMTVASLGGRLQRVEFAVEARP